MARRLLDVCIAVEDLEAAVQRFSSALGVEAVALPPEHYAYPGLRGARFFIGDSAISLVASDTADSPIGRFLETRGEGINHVSFQVDDVERTMEDLKGLGIAFASQEPLPYSDGRVVFAHPRSFHGVQVAFVETEAE